MIRVAIFLLLLLIFNLCFFVIVPLETLADATWVTFAFMNLAIIAPLAMGLIPMRKPEVKGSVVMISSAYAVLEVIAGVILLICGATSVKWCFVGQFIPFCIMLVMCLAQYSLDRK